LIWTERQFSLLTCEFLDDGTIAVPHSVPGSPREQPADTDVPRPLAPDSTLDPDDELRRYFAFLDSDTHISCLFSECKNSDGKQRALSRLLGGLDLFRQGSKRASVAVSKTNISLIIGSFDLATMFTSGLLAALSPIYLATLSPTAPRQCN